jgi:hypothetical protein
VRSAPGSAQPFDANVLDRATRTLQSARAWNAFIPVRSTPAELEAAPSAYAAEPVYPAELPVAHPTSGRYADTEPPVIMEGPIVMSTPPGAIQLPRQRTSEPEAFRRGGDGGRPVSPAGDYGRPMSPAPLRRRVPGSQLPADTGIKLPSAPPSTDDALAAREAFEAFEAGVSRAQWDFIEADMASPPAAGHAPLSRRVPGATLPIDEPPKNPHPPASPPSPLDPDAARAMV